MTISPADPVFGDTLTCRAEAIDLDGDEPTITYAWTVRGGDAGEGETLGQEVVKDEEVVCSATANDGTEDSESMSDSVTVGNTAPTAPTVDATDEPEAGSDDIFCEVTAESTDVDAADTLTYDFSWYADGAVYPDDFSSATGPTTTAYTGDTVPAADTSLAMDWTCTVVATDGTDSSAGASDTTVTVTSGSISGSRDTIASSCSNIGIHNSLYALAQPFTTSGAVTVSGFGIGFDTASGSQCSTCYMAVYDDSSGPNNLLGEASFSCSAGGEVTHSLSSSFSIGSAGTYWVAHSGDGCSGSSSNFQVCESTTSATTHYAAHSATTMPDPFISDGWYTDEEFATWVVGY